MIPAADPDRTIPLFGRRVRVGDFRPWGRLLVLGAMLAAISVAARSLSRQLAEAALGGPLAALAEIDERATLTWHPLVSADGFPSAFVSPLALVPATGVLLTGRAVDAAGRPLEGALVQIPGRKARTDRDGRFTIDRVAFAARFPLRIDPPASRPDLQPTGVASLLPGLPRTILPVGTLRCSEGGSPRDLAPADLGDLAADTIYVSRSTAPAEDSLDGWEPFAKARLRKGGLAGVWFRRLDLRGSRVALSSIARHPAACTVPPEASQHPLQAILEGAGAADPEIVAWVDLFGSGVPRSLRVEHRGGAVTLSATELPSGDHRIVVAAPRALPACADVHLPLEGSEPLRLRIEEGASVEILLEGVEPPARQDFALRVTMHPLRTALVGFPSNGPLVLGGLPAETVRFELVRGAEVLTAEPPPLPAFERTGLAIARTLTPGGKNSRVVFHAERLPPEEASPILTRGTTKPGAIVYREGARGDEPSSWTRADERGAFALTAVPGTRLFAALGPWPRLVPFTAGVAAPDVRFGHSVSLTVVCDRRSPWPEEAEICLRFFGPESLGTGTRTERASRSGTVTFGEVPPDVPFAVELLAPRPLQRIEGRTPKAGSTTVVLGAERTP